MWARLIAVLLGIQEEDDDMTMIGEKPNDAEWQ
jgi:hypothetical protein